MLDTQLFLSTVSSSLWADRTRLSIAGVETSTVSLSYMLYNLALYPDILAKLREEVDPLMTDSSEDGIHRTIPDTSVLSKLPYLNAIFKEC